MKLAKVYLMQEDNDKKSLEGLNTKFINEFCEKFGGCTTYTANGYYVGKGGKVYQDKDLVVEIFVDMKDFHNNKKSMFAYFRGVAKRYQKEAKQESVSIVIDGNAYIID
jgi:hypothetical protein